VNNELLEVTPETVTLALLAVRVPDAVPVLPSSTLPKSSVAGVTVSCPLAVVVKCAGPLTPPHAAKRLRLAKINSGPAFLQKLLEEICLFAIVIVVTHGAYVP
jgi:hypothetical protein